MPESIRVVIADDDAAIRERLRSLSEKYGAVVVAEARNAKEAIDACELLSPDLVLLDIKMPGMSGFGAAKCLRGSMPGLRIVFISQYAEQAYVDEAFKLGAAGYVLKSSAGMDLCEALTATMEGRTFVSPFPR